MTKIVHISNPTPEKEKATLRAAECIKKGYIKGLQAALDKGADPCAIVEVEQCESPLLHLININQKTRFHAAKIIRLLIARGAHPDVQDNTNHTVFQSCCSIIDEDEFDKDLSIAAVLAEEGADLTPGKDASLEGHDFAVLAKTLWSDVADKLRGFPLWSAEIVKQNTDELLTARGEAIATDMVGDENENLYKAFHFLSAFRETKEPEVMFDVKTWLSKEQKKALEWLTPARVIRHLASVMSSAELFSPARWRGHEEDALNLIAKQRPWLREGAAFAVPLLQAAMDRRMLDEVSPLSKWKQHGGWEQGR